MEKGVQIYTQTEINLNNIFIEVFTVVNTTSQTVFLPCLQIKKEKRKKDLYCELRESKEKLSLVITLLKKKPVCDIQQLQV